MKQKVINFIVVSILASLALIASSIPAHARTQVDENTTEVKSEPIVGEPAVGEKEARKYFQKNSRRDPTQASGKNVSDDEHYLAIHLGSFISSDAYQWGQTPHVQNVGRLNAGFTYRLGMFGSFADSAIRADFIGYELPEARPVQLVILPMLLFPEAGSKFPLYFGLGAGAGFFFNQAPTESFISFNYQLVAGARFFNVLENTGFFIEGGIKNNILLLSDGQFMGYFLALGTVFSF
jgi:hypothetical protein